MQPRSSRQGFSLIEVAIALVIFVIGALAIIKIFPGALNVIGNNGDQQIAMNLNRDVAARLKTDDAVPSSTFNIAVNNGGSLQWTTSGNADHTADYTNPGKTEKGDIAASVIGIPRFNYTLPTTNDINTQSGNSALSHFRGIIGEQAKVLTIKEGTDDVPYVTTQFPLSLEKINGGTTDTLLAPTISQEYVIRNARIDKQGKVTFINATTEIDGKQVRLDTPMNMEADLKNKPTVGSMLYVSYRYFNTNGKIWSVQEEAIPVATSVALSDPMTSITLTPPTTTRGSIAPYVSSTPTTGTVAEEIDVRVKRLVGTGVGLFGSTTSPATTDPAYPNADQITSARCGLVRLPGSLFPNTDTVSVDYIADWSWLMQKGSPSITPSEIPATALTGTRSYQQIALGAPFIEDQVPIGIYSLLLEQNAVSPMPQLYVSRYGNANPNPDPSLGALAIPTETELKSGKVTFSVANSESKARVAYRTRDSWAQQLSVAASTYKPYVVNNTEPWRDYYLGDDNYIYFHASEAGKTVDISYLTTDGGGSIIADRPFVIDQQIIATPAGVPATFASSGQVSRALLTNFSGGILASADLVSIQSVKGDSVTMRTAYINGDKYAQTLLTSNRGTN